MRKNLAILCLTLFLTLAFAGLSHAAENPFKGLSQEQIIQKYFDGRQLDTFEGIWLDDKIKPTVIIKSSLITIDNSKNYDYFMVRYSTSSETTVVGVRKTQHPSIFESGNDKMLVKLVSPSTFMVQDSCLGVPVYLVYTRTYPTEMK